jgi:hypothetical protein
MSNTKYENTLVESIATKAVAVGLLIVLSSVIVIGIICLVNPSWIISGVLMMFPFFIAGIIIIALAGKVLGITE